MDQKDFRQFLASSSSELTSGGDAKKNVEKRLFGKQQKRSIQKGKDESNFLPRKLNKKENGFGGEEDETVSNLKKPLLGDEYTDRAKARRMGKDELNEFHEVELLKRDFTKRIEEAKSEKERNELRKQMGFLGGDAKHTVLVNGLDFALLEQQRAKLDGEGGDNIDQSLEAAFVSSGSGTSKLSREKQKDEVREKHEGKLKGFKPIGKSSIVEESPEYIWRDGKRMRKKRKHKQDEAPPAQTAQSNPMNQKSESNVDARETEMQVKAKRVKAVPKMQDYSKKECSVMENRDDRKSVGNIDVLDDKKSQVFEVSSSKVSDDNKNPSINDIDHSKPDEGAEDDEDEDIFADAGRWNGFGEVEEEEEEEEEDKS